MKAKAGFTQCLDWLVSDTNIYAHFERVPGGMNLQLIQTGWHTTVANYAYGPMARDHYLIHFIRKGCGVMSDMQNEYAVRENQCFLICPGRMSLYEADHDAPWEYYWLGFDGPWGEEVLAEMQMDAARPVANLGDSRALFGLLDRMTRAIGPHGNYLILSGLMFEVLDILRSARGTCEGASPATHLTAQNRGRKLVESIMTMVENSFGERLNISEIAKNLGYSRSYMTELFHRETGVSISQYITEYRLQRANMMLRDPSRSIQQIAFVCGYSDPLFFSRMFKKRFGVSPRQFREQCDPGERLI